MLERSSPAAASRTAMCRPIGSSIRAPIQRVGCPIQASLITASPAHPTKLGARTLERPTHALRATSAHRRHQARAQPTQGRLHPRRATPRLPQGWHRRRLSTSDADKAKDQGPPYRPGTQRSGNGHLDQLAATRRFSELAEHRGRALVTYHEPHDTQRTPPGRLTPASDPAEERLDSRSRGPSRRAKERRSSVAACGRG